jgi:hypothetical protein
MIRRDEIDSSKRNDMIKMHYVRIMNKISLFYIIKIYYEMHAIYGITKRQRGHSAQKKDIRIKLIEFE